MKSLVASFFVVWRETFEALLIVFMIWTGFSRQGLWIRARPFVVAGLIVGCVLSAMFAWAVLFFSDSADGGWTELLQAGAPLLAAVLMLHMVTWMSAHAQEISGEIRSMSHSTESRTFTWGVLGLVAYALTREGFETVVYLYGMSMNPANKDLGLIHYFGILLAGTSASCVSLYALKRGLGFFKLKTFFRVTNFFLLGTAASMVVSGINKLIELEYLPPLIDPIWDTSSAVSGESHAGQALNLFVGYVPQPSLTIVIAYLIYWMVAVMLLFGIRFKTQTTRQAAKVRTTGADPVS